MTRYSIGWCSWYSVGRSELLTTYWFPLAVEFIHWGSIILCIGRWCLSPYNNADSLLCVRVKSIDDIWGLNWCFDASVKTFILVAWTNLNIYIKKQNKVKTHGICESYKLSFFSFQTTQTSTILSFVFYLTFF